MKFFIGLLIGVGIAGGGAYYLSKAQNPFVDKGFTNNNASQTATDSNNSSAPMVLAPGTKMQQLSAASAAVAQNNPEPKPAASAGNYDFYDVLQGKKNLNTTAASQPTVKVQYYVQAGAFSDADLANNMKAKLALLGISSKISASNENDTIINKVLIGPFSDATRAQNTVSQLNDQSINSTVINIKP